MSSHNKHTTARPPGQQRWATRLARLIALLLQCVAADPEVAVATAGAAAVGQATPTADSRIPANVQRLLDRLLQTASPEDVPHDYTGRFAFASAKDQALLPAALLELAGEPADETAGADEAAGTVVAASLAASLPTGAAASHQTQPAAIGTRAAGPGGAAEAAGGWLAAFLGDTLSLQPHTLTELEEEEEEEEEVNIELEIDGTAGDVAQDNEVEVDSTTTTPASLRRLLGPLRGASARRWLRQKKGRRPRPRPRPARRPRPAQRACPPKTYCWVEPGPQLKRVSALRIVGITVAFENNARAPRYGYAEKLGDGRGITFGRCGFCTGTGDGVRVINLYAAYRPKSKLASYLPALRAINEKGGGDNVDGLDGFEAAVAAAAADSAFRYAQDVLHETMYYRPAMALSRAVGARFGITKGEIYDTFIQHGWSDSMSVDSVGGITQAASAKTGGRPMVADERRWLANFLEARRAVLGGAHKWLDATYRVDAYQRFLDRGNLALNGPVKASAGCGRGAGVGVMSVVVP
ncbi:hypothetical protein CHLNCDRAFT_138622 [Chlorella variabilis]|uniref:Uncharacterized protein n=1 Tax=Chlorella variabilis TaxID=554065 RepID=E1ZNE8_CHLVA|nr:hypothetical protein CHLNCDRAFT_138622 [Chlorella variabilis]EFN52595.1 hypothetical protein CHLNCDRAFT_138622 [Chlorella variabilis]|eukprot:XP_005844697.1 hypothetical protein CHLNCDRAFT_138622 [Chlorella variabilis]